MKLAQIDYLLHHHLPFKIWKIYLDIIFRYWRNAFERSEKRGCYDMNLEEMEKTIKELREEQKAFIDVCQEPCKDCKLNELKELHKHQSENDQIIHIEIYRMIKELKDEVNNDAWNKIHDYHKTQDDYIRVKEVLRDDYKFKIEKLPDNELKKHYEKLLEKLDGKVDHFKEWQKNIKVHNLDDLDRQTERIRKEVPNFIFLSWNKKTEKKEKIIK